LESKIVVVQVGAVKIYVAAVEATSDHFIAGIKDHR
jgi:hypothetical protein